MGTNGTRVPREYKSENVNILLAYQCRHGTAFHLKKYRNYRRIIAKIQATFPQNKGYLKWDSNEFEW